MWIFLVVAVIAAVLLYPYIAVAFFRYRSISDMRIKIRRAGGRIRTLRRFVSISANRSSKYDLLVEKNNVFYAVKFWSASHKNVDLRIYSDGRVGEERTLQEPMTPHGESKKRLVKYSARYVKKTEYNFKNPNEKKIVNVILVYPSYRKIILEKDGQEQILNSGDLFFDKIILTPFSFVKMLSNIEK